LLTLLSVKRRAAPSHVRVNSLSDIHIHPYTAEEIRIARKRFYRRQRRRQWFEALGTRRGIYAVFMTGMIIGLLLATIIVEIMK
jgi:hypothetical protein